MGILALQGSSDAKRQVNRCCHYDEQLGVIDPNKQNSFACKHLEYLKEITAYDYLFVFNENHKTANYSVVSSEKGDQNRRNDSNFCLDFDELATLEALAWKSKSHEPEISEFLLKNFCLVIKFQKVFQCIGSFIFIIIGMIYVVVPHFYNYHGKALIGHTFSLAVMMVFDMWSFDLSDICLLNIIQFYYLCSDFWLLAMWINIWCLSRFPNRVELRGPEFMYTSGIIVSVTITLLISSNDKLPDCISLFANFYNGLLHSNS